MNGAATSTQLSREPKCCGEMAALPPQPLQAKLSLFQEVSCKQL
jgi:hypothetical protein